MVGRGERVCANALSAPVAAQSASARPESITKDDMGKRSTQPELDKYLSTFFVSSPIERVKHVSPDQITVRR